MRDEFYIGWQEKAPSGVASRTRAAVITIGILALLVCAGFVFTQLPFNHSTFEITRLRTIEGILEKTPIPCLRVAADKNKQGEILYQRILLIGFGKHSALPTIDSIEAAQGKTLDGQGVQLEGKLIYYDGQTAMELTNGLKAFKGFAEITKMPTSPKDLGAITVRGEMLDPKCYLGVMKPGEGKPHRSCAVRCIQGGIPALFKTTLETTHQYFFLIDSSGQDISKSIAPYIGDDLQLCGKAEQWDNWLVLRLDMNEGFTRLLPFWKKDGEIPMCH